MILSSRFQMNASLANLINAVLLFICSGWIFTSTGYKPILMALLVGILLLSLNNGVKAGMLNQIKAAAVLSMLGLVTLYQPTLIAYTNHNQFDLVRLGIMILMGIVSTFLLLKFLFR
jgi:hypothetical protein